MSFNKPSSPQISALNFAIAALLLSTNLHAGVINNSNPDVASGAFLGDCGTVGAPTACVGAMNLNNVDVNLVRLVDGSPFGSFDKTTGAYSTMAVGDSFVSVVKDGLNAVMAKITGKVWPVGEPVGVKAVVDDNAVKKGKPKNCLINTAYMSADDSTSGQSAYLDTAHPEPVICSSPFQTHKRFKIGMQPATVSGVLNGAEGNGIDLVFNVADEVPTALRPYQVFSKINNYTGLRLKGYKIVVGKGVGSGFQSASTLGIADKLHISLGIGEGASGNGTLDGTNLFDDDGLATFSHGLFGAPDQHFTVNGFFDSRTAGFNVAQTCSVLPCTTYPNPYVAGAALINSDTIFSTTVLPSNYNGPPGPSTATLFNDWLPSIWQPKGIFFDTDGDPTTDAKLVAWWDGATWRKNFDSGFAVVSAVELASWAGNPLYAVDDIEDVLNLGINYIVKVGNVGTGDITVRIIPIVADTQVAPAWVATPPPNQSLNVDNSDTSKYDAATDGVLVLRYLFGFRDAALVDGALGSGPALRDATQIAAYINGKLKAFDVDGDTKTMALTDGLMILRRLLGLSGSALTANANPGGASDASIAAAIDALKQ